MSGDVHKNLAIRAECWLRGRCTLRGMRGGFETPVAESYVADFAAICGMQNRWNRHYTGGRQMLERRNGISVAEEFVCVFECKATREDFIKTFGKLDSNRHAPIGSLHWIVVPNDNIVADKDLGHWGVLVRSGSGLSERRRPKYVPIENEALFKIAYHILWYGKEWPG